jgi:hypothetical protein
MRIARMMKRWLLVIPGCLLLSAVTWGQSWGPRASVQVVFGAPVRYVPVVQRWDELRWNDRRWDDRRWDRDRGWRQREWRERERREDWRRYHRREEWREHYRRY